MYSRIPSSSAAHVKRAHFIRIGNLRTPWRDIRSFSLSRSMVDGLSPYIIDRNISERLDASERVLPLRFSVIMDAVAWLIEQPSPLNEIRSMFPVFEIVSSSTILSPQKGLNPSEDMSGWGICPLFFGRL